MGFLVGCHKNMPKKEQHEFYKKLAELLLKSYNAIDLYFNHPTHSIPPFLKEKYQLIKNIDPNNIIIKQSSHNSISWLRKKLKWDPKCLKIFLSSINTNYRYCLEYIEKILWQNPYGCDFTIWAINNDFLLYTLNSSNKYISFPYIQNCYIPWIISQTVHHYLDLFYQQSFSILEMLDIVKWVNEWDLVWSDLSVSWWNLKDYGYKNRGRWFHKLKSIETDYMLNNIKKTILYWQFKWSHTYKDLRNLWTHKIHTWMLFDTDYQWYNTRSITLSNKIWKLKWLIDSFLVDRDKYDHFNNMETNEWIETCITYIQTRNNIFDLNSIISIHGYGSIVNNIDELWSIRLHLSIIDDIGNIFIYLDQLKKKIDNIYSNLQI